MGKYNSRAYGTRKSNPNLSMVSLNVSDDILNGLAYGQAQGWWATRSEGARIVMNRGLNVVFKEKLTMIEEIDSKVVLNLDPEKDYVRVPGKGYIEILGEA